MADLGFDFEFREYLLYAGDGEPMSAFDELRQHRQWVAWKYVTRAGSEKPTKPPINPHNGLFASTSDPNQWGAYEEAAACAKSRGLSGVGFVLLKEQRIIGIDLDNVRDPQTGEIVPWLKAILGFAETYSEVSPSGRGIRILARGVIDRAVVCHDAQVEMYSSGRYLTITQAQIDGSPVSILQAPKMLAALLARVEAIKPTPVMPAALPTVLPQPVHPSTVTMPPPANCGDFFQNVNDAALANLDAWVPVLFSFAKRQASTGGYRITSKQLGRSLQEDLGITPQGIRDFGLESPSTSINVVMDFGGAPDAITAAKWLCEWIGIDRESLGYQREDPALAALGNTMAEGLLAGTDGTDAATSAWNSPDLSVLSNGRRPPPTFDPVWLGAPLKSWAELQAKGASAPLDYVGVSMLSLAAAVLGNARWPQAGAGWWEPPILWCVLVGSPSSGKSPAMSGVTSLLEEAERLMAKNHDQGVSDYEAKKIIAVSAKEKWEATVRLCEKEGRRNDIPDMPPEAKEPSEPICPKIKVGDATTEKLGLMAAGMPNGLLLARDELDGWYASFGRYGSAGTDRAFALEMYGGRSYSIERVKHPAPIRIDHLSIGVLGGIQPDKVAAILTSVDDGLVARCLWCFPEPMATFSISRDTVPAAAARAVITRLSKLPMGLNEAGESAPVRVALEREAVDLLEKFGQEIAERARETTGVFAGALGKARGHVLRLSCVLEHLWWATWDGVSSPPTGISKRAVSTAIEMMDEYFLPMAERVLGDATISVAERDATTVARELKKKGLSSFNARSLRREIGRGIDDAAAMDAACAVLEEAGIVRARPTRNGPGKGRAAKNYEVNPALHGAR
ncbi:DUF3987 domain-containing protein [Starkeya sp. ORNL1]|uniref:DUF3987 domain-containing protein n=1 Tax=Starkeya sp. ORNL1 TaxID=2709380 RepID=UPI0014638A9C|nr:DUF3987 domain-containing protein [Starkeya sp. ORNL1]QJP14815.1 DUF3987 domain-containing protein [Starkeya sp. ORNL1]